MTGDHCWFVISRDLILIIGLGPSSPQSLPPLTSVTCLHSPDCVHYSSPALQITAACVNFEPLLFHDLM